MSVLVRDRKGHRHTGRRPRDGKEAETGGVLPRAREPLGRLEAGRGTEGFSPRTFGGSETLLTP